MTDAVVLSLEPWDGVWRRNQYLMDGLMRRDPAMRMLFVEPALDHLLELRSGRGAGQAAGLRTHPGYEGRLHLYQPGKVLPRLAGPLADALLRRGLYRAIRRIGLEPGILWVNDPAWASIVPRPGWTSLYDITDDWTAADRPPRLLARTVAQERRLLARADAVVVCSDVLADRRRPQRPDLAVVRNAVDLDRYRVPRQRPDDLPAGPVAVYAGTLHEDRLDLDLVVRTGRALADAGGHLVLLGPDATAPATSTRLHAARGIRMLGARDHREVPAYLQHADVLVTPHLVDAFTDSLDPIKLWEYLAVGRPVVSTPVAGFRDPEVSAVVVVSTAVDFPAAVVRAAIGGASPGGVPVQTWDERVDEVGVLLAATTREPGARRSL